MKGLDRRLRLLEASGDGECPECGFAPGAPFEDYEVLWHDTEDPDPAGPEWCGTCGCQTAFVVVWPDIDPDPWPALPGEDDPGPADPGEGDR